MHNDDIQLILRDESIPLGFRQQMQALAKNPTTIEQAQDLLETLRTELSSLSASRADSLIAQVSPFVERCITEAAAARGNMTVGDVAARDIDKSTTNNNSLVVVGKVIINSNTSGSNSPEPALAEPPDDDGGAGEMLQVGRSKRYQIPPGVSELLARPGLHAIIADLGMGKTALIVHLLRTLRARRRDVFCYFFRRDDRNTVAGALASLHSQLRRHEAFKGDTSLTKNQLVWEHINNGLGSRRKKRAVFLFDGIDECSPNEYRALTQLLPKTALSGITVIVTSRQPLHKLINHPASNFDIYNTSFHLNYFTPRNIRSFLAQDKLDVDPAVTQIIMEKTQGYPRHVQELCRELVNYSRSATPDQQQLRQWLEAQTVPDSLEAEYERALNDLTSDFPHNPTVPLLLVALLAAAKSGLIFDDLHKLLDGAFSRDELHRFLKKHDVRYLHSATNVGPSNKRVNEIDLADPLLRGHLRSNDIPHYEVLGVLHEEAAQRLVSWCERQLVAGALENPSTHLLRHGPEYLAGRPALRFLLRRRAWADQLYQRLGIRHVLETLLRTQEILDSMQRLDLKLYVQSVMGCVIVAGLVQRREQLSPSALPSLQALKRKRPTDEPPDNSPDALDDQIEQLKSFRLDAESPSPLTTALLDSATPPGIEDLEYALISIASAWTNRGRVENRRVFGKLMRVLSGWPLVAQIEALDRLSPALIRVFGVHSFRAMVEEIETLFVAYRDVA